jgi:hypothetical protein
MLSTSEIILEYVSPLLGAIFANLMFAGETKTISIVVISLFVLPLSHFASSSSPLCSRAPLNDVREAVGKGSLGHLNPTPWAG